MDAAHSAGKARKKRIRAERNGIDLTFLFLVLILLSIGLIMMFSASYASSYYETGDSFYYIKRQLLFAVVGVVMMLAIANIDYHILHRFAFLIYAGTLFLLVVVLIVPTREDAKRWINLGFTTFQPSELAKFAIVLIFAHLISVNYERMKNPRYGVWPFLVLLGVVVMLMLLEPHLSGTILIVSIGVVMMFVGGTDLKWFMLGGVLIGVAIVAAVLIPGVVPYAMDRLQYWIDPWSDPQNKGFQTILSLYAIADNTGGRADGLKYRRCEQYDPEHGHQPAVFLLWRHGACHAAV